MENHKKQITEVIRTEQFSGSVQCNTHSYSLQLPVLLLWEFNTSHKDDSQVTEDHESLALSILTLQTVPRPCKGLTSGGFSVLDS